MGIKAATKLIKAGLDKAKAALGKNGAKAGGAIAQKPGLGPALARMAGTLSEEQISVITGSALPPSDAEIVTGRINHVSPTGEIMLSKTYFIESPQGTVKVTELGITQLVDGGIATDPEKITSYCQFCGGLTLSQKRCAESGIKLCEIHALPHPYRKEAFISPSVLEALRDDSWRKVEESVQEMHARRVMRRMRDAELKKKVNEGGNHEQI